MLAVSTAGGLVAWRNADEILIAKAKNELTNFYQRI
jgi:hypothetical protein